MIARIKGRVDEIKPTELILDVNGIGYRLRIPISTYEKIHDQENIKLEVYTLHKEDQFLLFGFHSKGEKELFTLLLGISGIGPSMALSIISGISLESLAEAVKTENTNILTRIPGIGKTKAEKLIFELKRKIKDPDKLSLPSDNQKSTSGDDAVQALVSLGFDEKKSTAGVKEILKEYPDASAEFIIKETLRQFS